MYFVIEHIDQLRQMSPSDSCFIQVVTQNDNYHPKLTSSSIVYYNDFKKGYILVIEHSEGLSLQTSDINKFLDQHKTVYLLDEKYHSYFFDLNNAIDLQFVSANQTGKFQEFDCDTHFHNRFKQIYYQDEQENQIVPITKHYEKCECLFKKVENLIGLETSIDIEKRITRSYKLVEEHGIKIDESLFYSKFNPTVKNFSIKDGIAYGLYNLYNVTGRPTNAFNSINFLAIPKEKSFRECFIPKNDVFVEFDFDSYHLRLIAKLTGFEWPKDSHPHVVLGKQYFSTGMLTEKEYEKSKEITFKQLYGGIEEQYKHIEFFSQLDTYIDKEWKKYNTFGSSVLPTGRIVKKSKEMNKLKLFNYIVQNLETLTNLEKIEKLHALLADKKSELILITYDSFLFDFSIEDGKQTLIKIKNILEENGLVVKHKHGKDYSL